MNDITERDGILVISHDAWRTGAPIVLLHFLRWLKANTDIPFVVLLRDGVGDLRSEFEALAPTFAWNELTAVELTPAAPAAARRWPFIPARTTLGRGSDGVATIARPQTRSAFAAYLDERRIRLIYSNTITNGEVLAELAGETRPVVTHVHELGYWILHRMDPNNVEQNRRHTARFIAVSQAVRENLVSNVGVDAERIDVVHEFIRPSPPPSRRPSEIRQLLGIPPDAFVIGGSGTTDWRKSPDLFVQLAAVMRRLRPEKTPHFVWVGGEHHGPTFAALWHDVVRTDTADRMHFIGAQPHPLEYFAIFDVFAMVSREDPFPLVCLEAASLEKPIVCFDRAGGMPEFVRSDAGMVVPFLDVHAMAVACFRLMDDPELKQQLGERASRRVREHHLVDVAAPRLLAIIRRFLR